MLVILKSLNSIIRLLCTASFILLTFVPSGFTENGNSYRDRHTHDSASVGYSSAKNQKIKPRTGEIYLIRGLANIFSLGMDQIETRMEARGLNARTFNHSGWKSVANDIIRRAKQDRVSYPIVIAGHSLGANSSVAMANYLADNDLEVALVVAYDPTIKRTVGKNVDRVINFYVPGANDSNAIVKGPGFTGKLENVDISDMKDVGHMNLEKDKKLQDALIDRVMKITKAK